MNGLFVQAWLTVRRAMASKMILAVLLLGLVVLALTSVGIAVALREETSPLVRAEGAMLLFALLAGGFGNFIALVLGATLVRADLRDGTILSVLSKPIPRWAYVVGSYLGCALSLLLAWAIFALLFLGLAYALGGEINRAHAWILLGRVLLALVLLSTAFFFSILTSAWIAAALALIVYYGDSFVALLVSLLRPVVGEVSERTRALLGYPFPATERLDSLFGMLIGQPQDAPAMGMLFLHLADYAAVMLVLAVWVFERKDIGPGVEA
ncbi:MAG: ABC transporter permease [Blastocatellia bacterium]|nr:ABC transporter permease [Blastocatellia bacterium]MCS7158368.1 ABC transporter permease [Blastocatellia bacterium]MCX7752874.1 ABC transporter permease [Blastocatellia bacterium]MDW8167930.1 ABC transporter permease [Acidobacteriota bacterium]MDW8255955.1 ABC transporter permease [Acidobacteriota bacterium]